jgi:tRNA 2-thiocytidine biosynthesis protein TtcA
MIKDGDRVLVACSGGKDSLALIHILLYFKSVAPIKFEVGVVTIDP